MCQSINFFGHSFVIILLLADRTILMIATLFQLRSSFQYQCFGSHGLADHQSTCMFPWVGLPGSLSPATSVCFFFGSSLASRRLNLSIQTVVFLAVSDYTVESYGLMASSAVTGQSFARGTSAFVGPHVFLTLLSQNHFVASSASSVCNFTKMVIIRSDTDLILFLTFCWIVGYQWASTSLGILAAVMGVFPFLFYKFGSRIRKNSRYAQELALLEREERERLKFIELQAMKSLANNFDEA